MARELSSTHVHGLLDGFILKYCQCVKQRWLPLAAFLKYRHPRKRAGSVAADAIMLCHEAVTFRP